MTSKFQISAAKVLPLALFSALAVTPALAQQQDGTVKANSTPVYSGMSPDSDVTSTLPAGKVVRVTLKILGTGGTWCSIFDMEAEVKLGYVRCKDLALEEVPHEGDGDLDATGSAVENPSRSRDQERWALAASAILSTFNHESLSSLSPGDTLAEARLLLKDSWNISNQDDLLQALDWIDAGGHRQRFKELGARSADLSADQMSRALSRMTAEDANSAVVAHRYYEKFGAESITGWDYARYINLCRWGVAAGYLSEDDAWPRVMHAAQVLQQTFSSWQEFGENYMVGREFWSLRQTKIDGAAMQAVYLKLINDRSSVWNRIPWDLPLPATNSSQAALANHGN